VTAKTPPRAAAAIAELRDAANKVRETPAPTDTDRAVVAVLEATAAYWALWFPESPTAIDRAALMLARAINQAPAAAAGPKPQKTPAPHRKAS